MAENVTEKKNKPQSTNMKTIETFCNSEDAAILKHPNTESSGLGRQQHLKFHEILKLQKKNFLIFSGFPAEDLIHNNYKAVRLLH